MAKTLFTSKSPLVCAVRSLVNTFTLQTRSKTSKGGPAFPQWQNHPEHYPLTGTGSVYDTKIVRKRQVTDLNVPNFEKGEPLRWSDWRMLRDVRRRYLFCKFYPKYNILYTIRKCKHLPNTIQEEAFEDTKKLPKASHILELRNRCIISSRSRGNLKQYKISRHQWRTLADYNMLSGVAKATW